MMMKKGTQWRCVMAFGVTAVAVALIGQARTASATVDAPQDVGDVVVVAGNDGSKEVTHGDADTSFSLRLPSGSTCPGDSAHDQWRTQSFIVPVTDDVTKIKYGAIGPEPWTDGQRYSLFMFDTRPYVHQLLLRNETEGQPGQIEPIPAMNFAVIAGEKIPSGTYRIGIACTYFGKTAKYWDAQIELTGKYTDSKPQLSWNLVGAPADSGSSGGGSGRNAPLVALIGVAAAAAVALVLWNRRTRGSVELSKEPR
jgi:hypothetical protein